MRKIVSVLLSVVLLLCIGAPALADSVDKRVMLGADNGEAAIDKIYGYFRINRGDVMEIPVTNQEEREYLAGLVPDRKIGSVALSSAYIDTSTNNGLEVESYNIDWVTPDMYRNALATAGIENAKVIVAAANPVSGTGALAGIYKAYEDITGEDLDETAKDVAAEELVITGDLQEQIGESASGIITDVKGKLDETRKMTDDEIRQMIEETAQKYDAVLNSAQIQQILDLLKKMQGLNININIFEGIANGDNGSGGGFWEAIGNFFKGIGDFFANLFGGGSKDEPDASASPDATASAEPEESASESALPEESVSETPAVGEIASEAPAESAASASASAELTEPAESDAGDEGLPSPDPETENTVYTGAIESVDAEESTVTVNGTVNGTAPGADESGIRVGLVSEDTIITDANTGKLVALSDLKAGDQVRAYFSTNETKSIPPQSPLFALLVGASENAAETAVFVRPQAITDGADGARILLTQNGDMTISVPADLAVETPDGSESPADLAVGARLVVWIDYIRETYPEQADAAKIMLYPQATETSSSVPSASAAASGE